MLPLKDDQPSYSTPYVNWFLIGLNILIFLFQATLDPRSSKLLAQQFGEVPSHLAAFVAGSHRYTLPQVVFPFFTSMFLHGGWAHVLGNMWFLYIFGDNVEDYLGHFKYLVFYLLSGLIAMGNAGGDLSALECADDRGQRSNRGSAGSVFRSVSASACADVVFCFHPLYTGVVRAGGVVCDAVSLWDGQPLDGAGGA